MDSSNAAPVQPANSLREPVIEAVASALGASGSDIAEVTIVGTVVSANDDTAPDKEPVAVTMAQTAALNVRTAVDSTDGALEETT